MKRCWEIALQSDIRMRVEGTRIKRQINRAGDHRHHRQAERRDGSSDYRVADLKGQIFSLGDPAGLMRAGCARSFEFIGELEDRSGGQTNLEQISQPVKDERERSWRGFNFFPGNDLTVLLETMRGEYQISGMSKRQRPDRANTQRHPPSTQMA